MNKYIHDIIQRYKPGMNDNKTPNIMPKITPIGEYHMYDMEYMVAKMDLANIKQNNTYIVSLKNLLVCRMTGF